jgi:hypothetical protein
MNIYNEQEKKVENEKQKKVFLFPQAFSLNNKQQQIACEFFLRLVLSKFHTKFCLFHKNTSQTHVSLSRRTFFLCVLLFYLRFMKVNKVM